MKVLQRKSIQNSNFEKKNLSSCEMTKSHKMTTNRHCMHHIAFKGAKFYYFVAGNLRLSFVHIL